MCMLGARATAIGVSCRGGAHPWTSFRAIGLYAQQAGWQDRVPIGTGRAQPLIHIIIKVDVGHSNS
jgi:hypothetical protein